MSQSIDGLLVQWGDRLLYPGNWIVHSRTPRLALPATARRAAAIRRLIHATVVRRAPQVMVKVTGGGRGMGAIAAHFRYISKNGKLEIEDDRGDVAKGPSAVRELADEWRFGGSFIDETSPRREAFNIMLSMPRGTDPSSVQWAARELAKQELADHKYVMVLHDHQANPHVHISVRAESKTGRRLNPRRADLQRWRETFAEKLRERGIEAEATRQAVRGATRNYPDLWRLKASADDRLRAIPRIQKQGAAVQGSRAEARLAWQRIAQLLAGSEISADRELALAIGTFQPGVTYIRGAHEQVIREPQPSAQSDWSSSRER